MSKLITVPPPSLLVLFQDQRGLCEEALLKVKGVISFTFQMASKRCTVRIRSDLATEVRRHTHVITLIKCIKNMTD